MIRAFLIAAAALLMFAAPAHALVQLDRGIAGARLGNSRAEVRVALGQPDRVNRGTNDFGPFTRYRYSGAITVIFQGNRTVTSVATTGRGDRTSRGVGVDTRETTLLARHTGVSCTTFSAARICTTGQPLPGRRVTNFFVRGGKITRIVVGIVID